MPAPPPRIDDLRVVVTMPEAGGTTPVGVLGPVGARRETWLGRHRYGLLSLVVLLLVGSQTLNGQWSSDMWEHAAVVRELIAHPFDPTHPQLLSAATHPGFSPYTVALGLAGKGLGAGAVAVLSGAAVLNVALLLGALQRLVVEVTHNGRAPFWALVFLLALWGLEPYRYSGFFGLNSIGFVAPYPSTFATAVGFATLVAAVRSSRGGRPALLVAVTIGTATVVLVHPLSASWLVPALVGVAISWRAGVRSLAAFGGALALALGLCLLWPYYSLVQLVTESSGLESLNQSMYTNAVLRIFPMLLGLVVVFRRTREDRRDLLGLWLGGALGLYALGAVLDKSTYGRALAFVVVVLVVALADGVGRIEASWSERSARRGERIGVVLLGGLLVAGLVTSRAGIIRMVPEPFLPESIRGSEELIRPDERYGFLVGRVGPTDVVVGSRLADTRVIPALAGRTLTLSVARPFVADADERRQAQREFLDPATSRERRGELQRRYRVRFVLLQAHDDRDRRLVVKLQRAGASVAYRNSEFVLVELPVPS
jgi:alpha-1,6-mannosyltransferase